MSKVNPKGKNNPPGIKKETKSGKAKEGSKAVKNLAADPDKKWDIYHAMAFGGLAVLLFLPPYFRGLFFAPEQEWALLFAAVVFWFAWLWKLSKRDYSFVSHPLDYFVMAFPVVYLISVFQAVNYGLAVNEVVKTTLYFMVYWLSSRLVRNDNDIVTILRVIYISAIGVALAGLATASGLINISDGFVHSRIYSTYQYPNALCSFLAASTFIGFYLWRRAGLPDSAVLEEGTKKLQGIPALLILSRFNKYLYAIGNFLLIAVLIGTKSQGGFLVFAFVFILFMLALAKGDRIPVLTHAIIVGIPSVIVIWLFLSSADHKNMGMAFLWFFAGLILAVAGQALFSLIEKKGLFQWMAAHKNIIIMTVMVLAVSVSIGIGVYISGHSDAVKNLVEEIRLRNATERMYFFRDALKMFKERPVIGWGGGGWQEAFHAYQSYLYNAKQVHGHYFQIMVETGITGILVMLGIWVSFLYACHRLFHRAKDNTRFLVLTITTAAVLIGLHAVIDFDLSLSALAMVLWTMFGLARGIGIYSNLEAKDKKNKVNLPPKYSALAVVSVVSILLVIFTGSLIVAGSYAKQSNKYIKNQQINQGVSSIKKAIANNPFNADYHIDLARIYKVLGLYDEGISEAQAALSLSKYSAEHYGYLTNLMLFGKKDSGDIVNCAEKTLSLSPFQMDCYELLSLTYFTVGYNELVSGNRDAAKQYFEQAVQVPGRITARMDSLSVQEKRLWQDALPLTSTPKVKLNVGRSQYFLGQWPEAEANLESALHSEDYRGEAALWLSIMKSRQGQEESAKALLDQANQLVPKLAQDYEVIKSLQIANN